MQIARARSRRPLRWLRSCPIPPCIPRGAAIATLSLSLLTVGAVDASAMGPLAVEIGFEAVDLADVVTGEDLWLYRYAVDGFDLGADHGLSIEFALGEYSALSLDGLASPPPAWDVLVLQPDPQLPASGLFDALAVDAPTASSVAFDVAFVWSGSGQPGAQPFVIYDEDFAPIGSGTTTAVPEPATAILVLIGLAGLGARRRRPRSRAVTVGGCDGPRHRSPAGEPARRARVWPLLAALPALLVACSPSDPVDEPAVHVVALPGGHTLRYWQLSETRVSRTEFEYEFAASLTSEADRGTEILAQVSSTDPTSVPTDAGLRFPGATGGTVATALDTFRLRHDRRAPFDPARIGFRLLDRFGGDLSRSLPATGRFRVDEIDGRSWFITPDGHPFFSSGLNHIIWHGDYSPPIDRRPYHEAVLAKYGDEPGWAAATEDRIRGWNINTVGAWSNDENFPSMPHTPVMSLNRAAPEVPGWPAGQTGQRIRDYFHPDFAANVLSHAGEAVTCAADPYCIGVFSDNEMAFGRSVIQFGTYVDAYLTLPPGAPGKLALQAFFDERYGGDIAAFNSAWSLDLASFDEIQDLTEVEADAGFCNEDGRRADRQAFLARATARYFEVIDDALEGISPDLLFLGTRFLAVYTAPSIYEAAAPHVDVISINDYDWDENGRGLFKSEGEPYGYLFLDDPVTDLETVHALTGKPLMITEWTVRTPTPDVAVLFPPFMPTVATQAERADRYEAFMGALIERPYMVGAHWFKFHDQPATGRGDGENSLFGVVNIEDTPYAELTERMAAVNARLYEDPPAPPAPSPAHGTSRVRAATVSPLGLRRLSIAPPHVDRTGFFVFILPGVNLATGVIGDDLLIDAGPVDVDGVAEISLAEDAIVGVEAVTGEIACFDLRAEGSFGELACDGGFGHEVSVTLETGNVDPSQAVTETFLGDHSGPGSATLQVPLRFVQLPPGSTLADCAAATAAVEPALAALTTATVTSTKGAEFIELSGKPFTCGTDGSAWPIEDGPGTFVLGMPLFDGRVPGGDLAAAFRFADSEVACLP